MCWKRCVAENVIIVPLHDVLYWRIQLLWTHNRAAVAIDVTVTNWHTNVQGGSGAAYLNGAICYVWFDWLCWENPIEMGKRLTSLNSGLRVFFFTVVLYLDFLPMSGCKTLCTRKRTKVQVNWHLTMPFQIFWLQMGSTPIVIATKPSKNAISQFCLLTSQRQLYKREWREQRQTRQKALPNSKGEETQGRTRNTDLQT